MAENAQNAEGPIAAGDVLPLNSRSGNAAGGGNG